MTDEREDSFDELLDEARTLAQDGRDELVARLRSHDPGKADLLESFLALDRRVERVEGPPKPARGADFAAEIVERLTRRRSDAFGRYEIKDELARGGQGVVLRVWDEDLRRDLAMKVILGRGGDWRQGAASEIDSRKLGRFLDEAQVAGQLDHPGIVPVHELGLDSRGRIYFTMKLVEGRSLLEIYNLVHGGDEEWTLTRALGVILKVCEATAYAHAKGVIHRDLKPANVMVGRFGEVYVMDWGLARVLDREASPAPDPPRGATGTVETDRSSDSSVGGRALATLDGTVIGTPAYMSPEQAEGNVATLDARSDVYSTGAMLYHLLTGQPPYMPRGVYVPPTKVLWDVVNEPLEPIRRLNPGVPSELVAICEKAVAKDPDERYVDTNAMAEDLRAFLEHRVVQAYETGALAELKKWVSRNRALAASIITTILIAIGGLGVVSYVQAKGAEEGRRVFRLSALQRLQELQDKSKRLWPAHPENRSEYESWLVKADALIAGLEPDPSTGDPGHRRQLEMLRERAIPGTSGAWQFEDEQDEWWHQQLEDLVLGIEALREEETGLISGISSEYGWGIARRLEFASTIEERSISGPDVRRRWEEARAAIASHPAYGGLDLEPQQGLVPLGPDPGSQLWEFWHLQTGEEPRRGADGRLIHREDMGLVFVLLPGGTFWMGAQSRDPDARHYDPVADLQEESPVHPVSLAPFLMSKYEMTQGQWKRFNATNPARYKPTETMPNANAQGLPFTLLHPVEHVTWLQCNETMKRLGLSLPTEAQWEYAARAGTDSIWWPGDDPALLEGVANLADAYADQQSHNWICEAWDDGYYVHAAVGTFLPNAFGLHDVHGNVWEWCLDGYDALAYGSGDERRDPVIEPATKPLRVSRGGDFGDTSKNARVAERGSGVPLHRSRKMGLRPARAISR